MMMLSGINLPERAMRQYISAALNLIVQVNRFSDGTRKVIKISEITGMEGEVVLMQDLFEFVATGINAAGKVTGDFHATGVRSIFTERMLKAGFSPV